jgi:hypothetical protein
MANDNRTRLTRCLIDLKPPKKQNGSLLTLPKAGLTPTRSLAAAR